MPRNAFYALVLAVTLLCAPAYARKFGGSEDHFWVPPSPPHAHYTINCRIDTLSATLVGSEVVRLNNESSRPLSRLALDWSLGSRRTLKVELGGAQVRLLSDSSQPIVPSPIAIDLPHAVSPGEQFTLTIRFSRPLPLPGGQGKIIVTDWYPRLWWGIETHDDFEVKVDVPSDVVLATSGRLNRASGRYSADNVAEFGLFLGRGFHIAEAEAGDVLVRCVFSAQGEECARLVLKTAVDAINFYRERFGFYPYKSLDIVPGYDQPVGGYPAATSLSVIHGEERMSDKPEIHWRWITAHEIGHMYWGEYVLDKDDPGWLWIGLGIYADREYIRARGWSLQMHRALMNRYVQGVKDHVNTTVAITPEQLSDIHFDFNNIVTHGKGFSIISALANYLGKETFNRIYARCLKQFGGGRLGAREFQDVCEAESGENLAWFFDQWVRSSAYLSYKISSQTCAMREGNYHCTVSVERIGTLRMPVPVFAYFDDGTSQHNVTDRLSDVTALEFTSHAPLTRAQIDPDSELAMIVPPPELTPPELTRMVERFPWTGGGKEVLSAFSRALELMPTDEGLWFKLGMLLYDGGRYAEALKAFQRTAEVAGDSSNYLFGALVWQGHMYDLLGRRDEAVREYNLALGKANGQEMHHSQYDMVVDRKWVEERLKHPFTRR